jgi:sucrose phosphorylase
VNPDAPQLIAYADRLGGSLPALTDLLRGPLAGAFGGVHVLPFYVPFDGADAGFDPVDHGAVDPRLGRWEHIAEIARTHTVMADVIVNHISVHSAQVRDVIAHGRRSPWAPMVLTYDAVFPDGASETDLAAIYRPRPGLPFTKMGLGGEPRLLWTTFTPQQIDLNVRHELGRDYLTGLVDRLTGHGVGMLRLDAAGYVGKSAGTDCFLTEDSLAFLRVLRAHAHERGASVLLEIHGHWQQQLEIATEADWVYDFALPPLVLHALLARDLDPLARWLAVRPRNVVSVLDTHDGIGVVDVGTNDLRPGAPGLLSDAQIDALVEQVHVNTVGASQLATGASASNLDLYQVNTTFYDALGSDDDRHLIARMLQLFLPGIPQVYYVGLLAGANDTALLAESSVGRDINRHRYTTSEIEEKLAAPVVRATLAVLRLRATHPAFAGDFSYAAQGSVLELRWVNGADLAELRIDVADAGFLLSITTDGETRAVSELAALAQPEPADGPGIGSTRHVP